MKYLFVFFLTSLLLACASGPAGPLPGQMQNSLGMQFVRIDSGSFRMGSMLPAGEVFRLYGGDSAWYMNEHPVHRVTITKPFMMGVLEVTRGQFIRFVKATGYVTEAEKEHFAVGWIGKERKTDASLNRKNPGHKQTDEHPVVCVTWNDAMAFIEWLNDADTSLPAGYVYDLPTEAEWEYACRAGSDSAFYWGNNPADGRGHANVADSAGAAAHGWALFFPFHDGYAESAPAGMFKPNAFGLKDMSGNVYEWTKDAGGDELNFYKKTPAKDPLNMDGDSLRMLRGGSWHSNQRGIRCAKRKGYSPTMAGDNVGFRVMIRRED